MSYLKLSTLPQSKLASSAFIILASIALLFLSAQISIPLSPVPLSFQGATVILLALTLSSRQISMSLLSYLFLGCMGLPVFANFNGSLPIGPSGGYLLGFLPGALIAHFIARYLPFKNLFSYLIAAIAGSSVIFFCGVMQLSHFIGMPMAIQLGLMPFVVSDPLKLIVVALLACQAKA